MNMLCKLVQSVKGARKQFFSPRKGFWSELHVFFKEFQVPNLCTVTHVLVSHVLPQLQLFRTHRTKPTTVTGMEKKQKLPKY